MVETDSFEFKILMKPISPLAQQLFHLPFVKTIYIAQNFVAIEKFNIVSWVRFKMSPESIKAYLVSGKPIITAPATERKIPIEVYAESTRIQVL